MDLELKYNQRNPGVKRLMREACELKTPTEGYYAKPLDDNLFEWHFTVHGSPGTEYEGGIYHGRILLPPEYPMKPPNIIILTPNGRFEINKKICLSISGHHPETWQPSWSIRTALLALIAFMSSPGRGSIGALDYTPEERRKLAKASKAWQCDECGPISKLLSNEVTPQPKTQEEEEMLQRIDMKAEEKSEGSEEKPTPSSQQQPLSPPPPTPRPAEVQLQNLSQSLGPIGDYLIVIFIAALALLIARRMALSYFA